MTVTSAPATATGQSSGSPPGMGVLGWARWAWRQLTSMRVALVLLFLLALASVPGSLFPQQSVNPPAVQEWVENNPGLAPWAERLDLFSVYSSPWFSAVYLLLMVSLVGCIVPRMAVHARALRTPPPRAPRRLTRLPASDSVVVTDAPDAVLSRAADVLRGRRYRVVVHAEDSSVSAERGYWREGGNLIFHTSVVVVLLAVAVGTLFGYRGSVLVVQGDGFSNSTIQYDALSLGQRVTPDDLPPFSLTVDEFVMDFVDDGPMAGTPAQFEARVTLVPEPGATPEQRVIGVNEPLSVDGSLVHLLNPGYAPVVTVADPAGDVVFSDAVPFLPQDANFTSTGVVKAEVDPDVGEDIGLQGIFLPTGVIGPEGPVSVSPEPNNPALVFSAWTGDLGLDGGVTQSIYRLDTSGMTQLEGDEGEPFRAALGVGESVELSDGAGTVTFEGYRPWVNLQVGRNAGKEIALVGTILLILGAVVTFAVRRRRVFVRVTPVDRVDPAAGVDPAGGVDLAEGVDPAEWVDPADGGKSAVGLTGSVVVVGGLDKNGSEGLQDEVTSVVSALAAESKEESPR